MTTSCMLSQVQTALWRPFCCRVRQPTQEAGENPLRCFYSYTEPDWAIVASLAGSPALPVPDMNSTYNPEPEGGSSGRWLTGACSSALALYRHQEREKKREIDTTGRQEREKTWYTREEVERKRETETWHTMEEGESRVRGTSGQCIPVGRRVRPSVCPSATQRAMRGPRHGQCKLSRRGRECREADRVTRVGRGMVRCTQAHTARKGGTTPSTRSETIEGTQTTGLGAYLSVMCDDGYIQYNIWRERYTIEEHCTAFAIKCMIARPVITKAVPDIEKVGKHVRTTIGCRV